MNPTPPTPTKEQPKASLGLRPHLKYGRDLQGKVPGALMMLFCFKDNVEVGRQAILVSWGDKRLYDESLRACDFSLWFGRSGVWIAIAWVGGEWKALNPATDGKVLVWGRDSVVFDLARELVRERHGVELVIGETGPLFREIREAER